MADVDFLDLKSAERWFEVQSVETRCMIISRLALRDLANVGLAESGYRETLSLVALRAILTSAGRGLGRPPDVQDLMEAARSAAVYAESAAGYVAEGYVVDDYVADYPAVLSALFADSAALFADCVALFTGSAVLSALEVDADQDIGVLRSSRVWAGAVVPEAIADNHENFLKYLQSHPDWKFWHRWYSQMWEGTFTDWDLAIEVAKIPNAVWDKGLGAVAQKIHEIEVREDLRGQIASLRAELDALKISPQPTMGHNQGPPLENREAAILQSFELIWPVINDLEQEIAKPEPDAEVVKRLAERLWQIAKAIAVNCGGKLDLALNKAAENLGESGAKWTVRVTAATYVGGNEGVQSVAKAAWKYALTLMN